MGSIPVPVTGCLSIYDFLFTRRKNCSHKNPVDCEEAMLETYNKMKLYYEPIKKDIYGGFAKLSKI